MSTSEGNHNNPLKRGLNLPLLLLYGVGNILGAGIYVLVGEVARAAGYYAPVAFLLSAFIAALTALTYVELSSRYPLSAGEAIYVDEGFHRKWLSIMVGVLVCAGAVISAAALSRGLVGYIQIFLSFEDWVIIVTVLLVLGMIAAIGITESVTVASIFTLLEVIGLLVIIWACRDMLVDLPERLPDLVPPLESAPWVGILSGAFLSFFAFIGFEDMVNVAEEVKNPRRTIPTAIILALLICSVLYGAIALAAVLAVVPAELGESGAPLAHIYQTATGNEPVFIGLVGLAAIVNGILIQLIMVSRILYGMSRKNWMPDVFGRVMPRVRTPVVAIAFTTAAMLCLALTLPLLSLAAMTSLAVLSVFTLVNASLIRIKLRSPVPEEATGVPMLVPVTGLAASLGLAAFSILIG